MCGWGGLSSLVNIHAIFGVSLVTFVVLRFHSRMRRLPRALPADIRAVSWHLSRMVYLLLGMLVVFKELAGSGTHDLHDYLVYALIVLLVIRLMALAYWHRAGRTYRASVQHGKD
jgi:cytochrome b561